MLDEYWVNELLECKTYDYSQKVARLKSIIVACTPINQVYFTKFYPSLSCEYLESLVMNHGESVIIDGSEFSFKALTDHALPHFCMMMRNERMRQFAPNLFTNPFYFSGDGEPFVKIFNALTELSPYGNFLDYLCWVILCYSFNPVDDFMSLMMSSTMGEKIYEEADNPWMSDFKFRSFYLNVSDFFMNHYDRDSNIPLQWQLELSFR